MTGHCRIFKKRFRHVFDSYKMYYETMIIRIYEALGDYAASCINSIGHILVSILERLLDEPIDMCQVVQAKQTMRNCVRKP